MELLGVVIGLVALAVVAWFDGADSRIAERDETRSTHLITYRSI